MSTPIRYRIIAFISGFVLMAYELAGSRILSPVVGSSTYVWTSIIGVIIAALSVGYFLGGWLADTRKLRLDIVLILIGSAVGILTTLLFSDTVLYFFGPNFCGCTHSSTCCIALIVCPNERTTWSTQPLSRSFTHGFVKPNRSISRDPKRA